MTQHRTQGRLGKNLPYVKLHHTSATQCCSKHNNQKDRTTRPLVNESKTILENKCILECRECCLSLYKTNSHETSPIFDFKQNQIKKIYSNQEQFFSVIF